jgi:hypothetical protein
MEEIDRRSMLGLGFFASTLVFPALADAQTTPGKELAPGVRQIDFGERESRFPPTRKFGCGTSSLRRGLRRPSAR